MRIKLFLFTIFSLLVGFSATAQHRRTARVVLADKTVLEVDDAWEESSRICYRLNNITNCKELNEVRRVEPPQIPDSTNISEAKRDISQQPQISIYLVGGARIRVDEATETSEGVWYRRGDLSMFVDRTRVLRVERDVISAPVVPAPPIALSDLPPNYLGNSPTAVYLALGRQSTSLAKSQFETSANYIARLSRLLNQLQIEGKIAGEDTFMFALSEVSESYDADSATISFKVDSQPEYFTNAKPLDELSSIVLTSSSKSLGSRTGQNAFGVKIKYRIVQYSALKLVMARHRVAPWQFKLLLPGVAPQEARKLMGGLRVALIGMLMRPYIDDSTEYDRATLSEPEEAHYQNYYLFFDPHKLVVFERRTGKLVGSLDLNKFPKTSNPGEAILDVPSLARKIVMPTDGLNRAANSADGEVTLLSKPEPRFPEDARARGFSGVVQLEVYFKATGEIGEIKVVRGLPYGLTESAIEAAKQIKFTPAQRNGSNISKSLILDYDFKIL